MRTIALLGVLVLCADVTSGQPVSCGDGWFCPEDTTCCDMTPEEGYFCCHGGLQETCCEGRGENYECCSSTAHCCPSSGCCANTEQCCSDDGGCCPLEEDCCGPYCCPENNHCCADGAPGTGCCPDGQECCASFCCTAGGTCCHPNDYCCSEGYSCCGDGCCPPGTECCLENTQCCALDDVTQLVRGDTGVKQGGNAKSNHGGGRHKSLPWDVRGRH